MPKLGWIRRLFRWLWGERTDDKPDDVTDLSLERWRFDYLRICHHVFGQMRAESRLGLAIPDNFAEWRAER
ncbi:hypothetical protein ACQW9R_004451, partial [Escherichia coli]